MTDVRQRAAIAERAARAGGTVARERFRGAFETETKSGPNDLVTSADYDAQQQIVHTVTGEFPADPFVCEESPTRFIPADRETDDDTAELSVPTRRTAAEYHDGLPASGPAWVVDPIDGTGNFVRGLPLWATSVATVRDGEPLAAATYLPVVGDIYTVGPDSATMNGTPLAVSSRTDPATFAVALVGQYPRDETAGRLTGAIAERFGDLRRFGSFQASLAFVADGGLEAAITPDASNPWDTIAGVSLVRAAGGTVTDLEGERWTPDATGLVASNGTDHDAVLAATREALEPGPEA